MNSLMALLEPLNSCGKTLTRAKMVGTWRASAFIIGVEIAERLTYAGIYANLVTYLTKVMHESTASASRNVNIWSGVAQILPFLGAFIADSYLGRYSTILWSSFVYLLGLVLMTLSATVKSLKPPSCSSDAASEMECPKASSFKIGLFFFALYLVALGQGGHKPCLQAFGADQFDDGNSKEKKQKSSFFNWWYFGISFGTVLGVTVLMYIQDEVGWGLGFGIPAGVMCLALLIFLCGTPLYRHSDPGGSPLTRIVHVFVAAYHKRHAYSSHEGYSPKNELLRKQKHGSKFRFLDKAAVADSLDDGLDLSKNWRLCTVEQIIEVKDVLWLFPIWAACLTFGIVFSQSATLFTKQGSTMDRRLGSFEVPAAALQSFIGLSILTLIPVYDKIFVPIARKLTGNERGLTLLQRIGTGIVISALSMVVSAFVEVKRINTAREHGLVDRPDATIPLSIFLLIPQYLLFGIADVFTVVGMQEFFYDQMPDKMKSLGIAIYLSVLGIGSILSGILISIVENLSCKHQSSCWISNNLNHGKLNYFYWFLAVLSTVNYCLFLIVASYYQYRNARGIIVIQETKA